MGVQQVGDASQRASTARRVTIALTIVTMGTALFALFELAGAGAALAQRFRTLPPPPQGRWYEVDREQGIVVRAYERGDDTLPLMRASGDVSAPLYDVAAVLWDADALDRWMAHTAESRMLERRGELGFIFYQRMGAPWPVADRDAVLSVQVELDPAAGRLISRFHEVNDARVPAVSGVVRMPRLRGRYEMRSIARDKTHVDLWIDADPGGALPRWLVRAVARQLPLDMLLTLRARLAEVGDRYAPVVRQWQARHGPMQVAAQP